MRLKYKYIDKIYINTAVRTSDFDMGEKHYHSYFEIYYLVEGTCRILINDKIYNVKAGDMVMIEPGDFHYTSYQKGITCKKITIYFLKEFLLADNNLVDEVLHTEKYVLLAAAKEKYTYIMKQMLLENKMNDENSMWLMKCYLTEFLLLATRYREKELLIDNTPILSGEEDILLSIKYIVENYSKTLTLYEVAGKVGLSTTYFSRKFKNITGISFKEYVNAIRLKQATWELLNTSDTITDIALRCGYNDSNYFKDLFKKVYGMSPREFRKY